MALVTYDVTAAVVMERFAQLNTGNVTSPGTTVITSRWINVAAARVDDAMREGGFDSSVVTSEAYPSAYYQLQDLLADIVAVRYMRVVGTPLDSPGFVQLKKDCKDRLEEISKGNRIGKLTSTTSSATASLYIGDSDTIDDIDDQRAAFDKEL